MLNRLFVVPRRQASIGCAPQSSKSLAQNLNLLFRLFSFGFRYPALPKQILVDSNRLRGLIIGAVKHRQLQLIARFGAITIGKQLEILNRFGEILLL